MKLFLVRHGRTAANVQGICQGQLLDCELDDVGREQAAYVAERFAKEEIHAAYASDALRARQTAQAIMSHYPHLSLVTNAQLRERNYGTFEGRPNGEYFPLFAAQTLSWDQYRPDGGESYADSADRGCAFIQELSKRHENETVLVVSHGGLITSSLLRLAGRDCTLENYREHRHENTAVTVVHLLRGRVEIELLACSKHLPIPSRG